MFFFFLWIPPSCVIRNFRVFYTILATFRFSIFRKSKRIRVQACICLLYTSGKSRLRPVLQRAGIIPLSVDKKTGRAFVRQIILDLSLIHI